MFLLLGRRASVLHVFRSLWWLVWYYIAVCPTYLPADIKWLVFMPDVKRCNTKSTTRQQNVQKRKKNTPKQQEHTFWVKWDCRKAPSLSSGKTNQYISVHESHFQNTYTNTTVWSTILALPCLWNIQQYKEHAAPVTTCFTFILPGKWPISHNWDKSTSYILSYGEFKGTH